MSKTEISTSEWKTALDNARRVNSGLTQEQFEFLDYAREGGNPIVWIKLPALFEKQFGIKKSYFWLREKYEIQKTKQGEK